MKLGPWQLNLVMYRLFLQKATVEILRPTTKNCTNNAIKSRDFSSLEAISWNFSRYDKLDIIFLSFSYFALVVDALM